MHMPGILTRSAHKIENGCRKRLSIISSDTLYLNLSALIQSTLYLFTTGLLPALFSCSSAIPEVRSPQVLCVETATTDTGVHTLDIFTFNDDILMRLDSYLRIEDPDSYDIDIRSQNGPKHIIICANARNGKEGWTDINSVQSLEDRYADLVYERRDRLLMTGRRDIMAGSSGRNTISVRPLVGEITLRSIRCDFTGRPYAGQKITDVSIYLTNVNARCRMLAEGSVKPTHIMNAGGLDPEDVKRMSDPDLLYRALDTDIGYRTCMPDIRFLCYPSSWPEESPGTPFTRLVIEGTLDGERLMWPIDVNRAEGTGNPGVHRNCSYVYDVVITRKGVFDPEETISTDMMDIRMEVRKWEEKNGYSIEF